MLHKRILVLVSLALFGCVVTSSNLNAYGAGYADIFIQGNIRDIDLLRQKVVFYDMDLAVHMGKQNFSIYVQIAGRGFTTKANRVFDDGSYAFQTRWPARLTDGVEFDLSTPIERVLIFDKPSSFIFPRDRYSFTIVIGSEEQIFTHNGRLDEPSFYVMEPLRYSWNCISRPKIVPRDEIKKILLISESNEVYPRLRHFAWYQIEFYRVNVERIIGYYWFPTLLVLALLLYGLLLVWKRGTNLQSVLTITSSAIFFIATFGIITQSVLPPGQTALELVQIMNLGVAVCLSAWALWKGRKKKTGFPHESDIVY